jgi:hypothetical protein
MSDTPTGINKERIFVSIFVLLLTLALFGLRATG